MGVIKPGVQKNKRFKMNVSEVVSSLSAAQATLKALTVLQLTSYMWPPQAEVQDGATYDMIIVGAGSAGCVLASRLSEVPELNILLIEAGGDPQSEVMFPGLSVYIPNSGMDWNYTSEPNEFSNPTHKDYVQNLIRGKMLGGSSSANFMAYARGHPKDYNNWAKIADDPTWEYNNVLPYFIRSERLLDEKILQSKYGIFHGTQGYLGVTVGPTEGTDRYLKAFEELGHDVKLEVNGNETLGFAVGMFTIADGLRQSTANSYLSPVKYRPNLHVLKNALVSKVIFEGKTAVGVEILLEDKTVTVKAKKEVILSAGAINTPQVLMLSGIGPKENLEYFGLDVIADLPVGLNFQDHVAVRVYFKMEKDESPKLPQNPNELASPTIIGHVSLIKDQDYPDYQAKVCLSKHDSLNPIQFCSFVLGLKDEICQVLADIKGRNIMYTIISHSHPNSRGQVHLRSTNPRDYPIINAGYFSMEEDIDDLAKYLQDFIRIANTTYFKEVDAEMVDFNLSECENLDGSDFWKCYARHLRTSQWDYCGTAALGTVVDSKLKVKGIQNLRIIDASVIPTLPSGNTNIPVIMIAEKASDIIKEDNGFKIRDDWF